MLAENYTRFETSFLWDNFMEAGDFSVLYCRFSFYFLELFYFYFWVYDGTLLG
jgi:hypothetical protein